MKQTPKQLACLLARTNPGKQFFYSKSSVAASNPDGSIRPLYQKLIGNLGWLEYPNVLVNGKPIEEDWTPVIYNNQPEE